MKSINNSLKFLLYTFVIWSLINSTVLATNVSFLDINVINLPNQSQPKFPVSDISPGTNLGQIPEGLPSEVDTSYISIKWIDVPYANISEAEKMDIFLPNNGRGPFPVVVSIHGGGFALGDKTGQGLSDALSALNRSYAVVSVNYRLSGEAKFPAQINDLKAAIRYIRANAAIYNLNPNKIAVWGGSAGGNLAALAGTSGDISELENTSFGYANTSDKVQAVIDWFGPINFLTMDDQFNRSGIDGQKHNTSDSMESQMLGKQITLVPELVNMTNLKHISLLTIHLSSLNTEPLTKIFRFSNL